MTDATDDDLIVTPSYTGPDRRQRVHMRFTDSTCGDLAEHVSGSRHLHEMLGQVAGLDARLQPFTAGQAVTISGIAAGELYEYSITEINGTGRVAFLSNDLANSGSGTLRTVTAGNTAYLCGTRK